MLGLSINGKHTFQNMGMKMLDYEISTPEPIIIKVEVPGLDGALDFSEYSGEIRYKERELKASFDFYEPDSKKALGRISEIMNDVNGLSAKIILDSDPLFFYKGRVKIDFSATDYVYYKAVLKAKVYPYKLKTNFTEITETVNGQKTITCNNLRKSVVPKIIATAPFELQFNGKNIMIPRSGTFIEPNIKFKEGKNTILCKGTGTITFQYQEGSL